MKHYLLLAIAFLGGVNQSFAQNWNTPQVLDNSSAMVGESSSLLVVNGNPAMSYYDETNGDLKYIRATNSVGTTWGSKITVQSSNHVGEFTSMAIVSSNPAISYYDQTNGNLMYVRANDASGSTWGTPVTVTSSGDIGQYTSLVVVSGNPAIAYYDVTNGDLKYVRATNTTGTTWGTPVTVSSTGNVGMYASMQIVNGNPAIAFHDVTNGDVEFVRATNTTGTTWGTSVVVQSTNFVGEFASLAIVNGNPAISYYDNTSDDLKFASATNNTGSAWNTPLTLDATGSVGMYTSLKVVDGYAAIAYFSETNGDLKYVRAINVAATSWGTPAVFETTGDIGEYACLLEVNGNPAISYHDDTNDDLRYVNLCNTWTGATSTAWSTASNWSFSSVPISTEEVHILDKINDPIVSSDVTVASMKISSGGSVTLSGSSTDFTVSGAIENGGVINIANGKLILGGAISGTGTLTGGSTSNLSITGAAGTLNFTSGSRKLLSLALSSTGSATLGTTLDIEPTGEVSVNSGGVLTSNGNLTLKSSASGTARVAAGSSSGNYIVGNVTTETYIAGGRRAFRFICHPFSSSIPLTQLTDDIDITGSGGGNNGFDYQPSNPASAFWYNPTTGNGSTVYDVGWTAFTSAYGTGANSWDKCEAARVLIRGSKGQGLYAGSYTPNAVTLDMTGPLNQGDVTINLTKGSNTPFVLIGNPFMSPVNLLLTTRTSVGANIIVWDANQGTRGGYTSIPLLSSIILPPGASFVTTVLTNGTMTFPESSKTSSTALGLLKTTEAKPVQVELKMMDSTIFWDKMLVMFNDTANATYDYADCLKMANPDISMYTFGKDDSILSIDCRKHVDSQSIRMGLYVPAAKKYRFVLGEFNMVLGTRIYLLDKYTNTKQEITSGFEYWFDVTSDTATQGDNRFELVMEGKPTKVTTPTSVANASSNQSNEEVKGFEVIIAPNPAASAAKLKYKGATAKELHISIINMLGAVVASFDTTATEINLPVQNLQTGMYMVEVSNGKETVVEKLIKE